MHHFVAECAQYVLDVPMVYEQNQLVVAWIIVARLDEQVILPVGGLVKNHVRNWVCLNSTFLEILQDLLNPEVQHIFLSFQIHDISIYQLSRWNGKYQT